MAGERAQLAKCSCRGLKFGCQHRVSGSRLPVACLIACPLRDSCTHTGAYSLVHMHVIKNKNRQKGKSSLEGFRSFPSVYVVLRGHMQVVRVDPIAASPHRLQTSVSLGGHLLMGQVDFILPRLKLQLGDSFLLSAEPKAGGPTRWLHTLHRV